MQRSFRWPMPFRLLLTLALALAGLGCSDDDDDEINNVRTIRGNGNVVLVDLDVSGFREVSLAVPSELRVVPADADSGSLSIEENLLEHVEWRVVGDLLEVRVAEETQLDPTEPIRLVLFMRATEALTIAGAGRIEATGLSGSSLSIVIAGAGDIELDDLDLEQLSTTVAGSGDFELEGVAGNQSLTIAGEGDYRARSLVSETVQIVISGSGSATVHATDALEVLITGAGFVYYVGDPELNITISGTGEVVRLE